MTDPAKLRALREKFAAAKGGDIFDPAFRAVADQQFSDGERRKWPFSDAATFLGAPYRPEAAQSEDFAGLDFALIGLPMDLGTATASCSTKSRPVAWTPQP